MKKKLIKKYAELIAYTGANVKKGQNVVITAPLEAADLVKYITIYCYEKACKSVYVKYYDPDFDKVTMMHKAFLRLREVPAWELEREEYFLSKNCASIHIVGEDPYVFNSIKPERRDIFTKSRNEAFYPFKKRYHENDLQWCIAAYPCRKWAKRIFPDTTPTQAVEELWKSIFKACYIDYDTDALRNWDGFVETIQTKAEKLNKLNLKSLHYKASNGTDLVIELAPKHIWSGAATKTQDGRDFVPNLPTQEVFTMPDCRYVNGTVYSSKPLCYNGIIINNFHLTFKDGEVVSYDAEEGLDALQELLEYDEGSKRLGEAALVPFDSPISNMNLLFLNTLFDENASCHLALGDSFAENIENGYSMDEQTRLAHGGNHSKKHVDFMIGTADMNIVGTTVDGKEVKIFDKGNFAF